MKYALGNMLNGAGGLNADKLALDLPFAVTKSLTAAKGPTPTFTRASSGTFVGSNGLIQSAGNNVARFDHDPVTLASRGLLIEESRTNQSLRSGAIVFGAGWFIDNATSTASETGPDGNTSYRITESTGTGTHLAVNTGGTALPAGTSIISGTVYTGSFFVKKVAGSIDWIQVTLGSGGFGTTAYANFNISNGTIGNSAGLASGTSPRIEDYGDGWYRCSISVAATATITSTNVIVAFIQNTNGTTRLPSYTGSTSSSVLAAMCQFEAGSFATSYIPTTMASVVRSADVCSITGGAFTSFWNRFAGTAIIGVESSLANSGRFISNTTSARALEVYSGAPFTNIDFFEASGGQEIRIVTGATFPIKVGLAYAINDYQSSYNGLLGGSDTNTGGTIPDATAFYIGTLGGSSARMTGHIQFIRYYKKRLSNAKLQAITV